MNSTIATPINALAFCLIAGTTACSDVNKDDHAHDHNHGLPTTTVLNFTDGSGDTASFSWSQPDTHDDAVIDTITLPDTDAVYTVTVEILNESSDHPEDLTPEIEQYGSEHQLFFTGSAVDGPAANNDEAVLAHAYNDEDDNGLPLGLSNIITVRGPGSGELSIMLRHMPTENGEAVKTAAAAETVANDGFDDLGGDIDLDVTFPVIVE